MAAWTLPPSWKDWCALSDPEISDTHIDVEWADDFEPTERQHFAWDLIAKQLKEHPGRWAKVPGASPAAGTGIKRGVFRAFRDGKWQTASRHGELFIRFLGPDLGHSDHQQITP